MGVIYEGVVASWQPDMLAGNVWTPSGGHAPSRRMSLVVAPPLNRFAQQLCSTTQASEVGRRGGWGEDSGAGSAHVRRTSFH